MIDVTCQCGRAISAPDEFAGKRVRCPACRQPVLIPDAFAVPARVAIVDVEVPPGPELNLQRDIADLRERLDLSERSRRRASSVGIAIAAVACILAIAPFFGLVRPSPRAPIPAAVVARLPSVIEAGAFVLKDGSGRVRGAWKIDAEGSSSLALNDSRGNECLELFTMPTGQCAVYLRREGVLRCSLASINEGPSLVLWGRDSTAQPYSRISLALDGDDWAGVNLYGKPGQGGINLGSHPDGTSQVIVFSPAEPVIAGSKDREPRYILKLNPDRSLLMALKAERSLRSLVFSVDSSGEPSSANLGSDGKPFDSSRDPFFRP